MDFSDEEELLNKNKPGITQFKSQGEETVNMFLEKDESRLGQSHRAIAARANLFNVNQIPVECELCKGDLEGIDAGRYICIKCGHISRDSIRKIRDYSEEHGAQPATVIARATGVDRKAVEHFLLEEHLEIPNWSSVTISCQKCGASIRTGRLCDNCKRHGQDKKEKNTNGLMYTRRKEED